MNNIGNNGLVITGDDSNTTPSKANKICETEGHHIVVLQCPGCGEEVEKIYKCPICGEHMKVVAVLDSADIDEDVQKDLDSFEDVETEELGDVDLDKDDSVAKSIDPFEI